MEQLPIVSVIIPVYNSEKYLPECLDSILHQSLKEVEVVCVDDGSTDGSLALLRDYAARDSRVVVVSQQNQYAGIARNNGMEHARGKYFYFMDSDDFLDQSALKEVSTLAERLRTDICLFGTRMYLEDTGELVPFPHPLKVELLPLVQPFSAEDVAERLFQISTPAPWNKLYRADFIREHGILYQGLKNSNDLCFTYTALSHAERIAFTKLAYLNYRTNNSSSLQGSRAKDPTLFVKALQAVKDNMIASGRYHLFESSFCDAVRDNCEYNFGPLPAEVLSRQERARILSELLSSPGRPEPIISEFCLSGAEPLLPRLRENSAVWGDYVLFWEDGTTLREGFTNQLQSELRDEPAGMILGGVRDCPSPLFASLGSVSLSLAGKVFRRSHLLSALELLPETVSEETAEPLLLFLLAACASVVRGTEEFLSPAPTPKSLPADSSDFAALCRWGRDISSLFAGLRDRNADESVCAALRSLARPLLKQCAELCAAMDENGRKATAEQFRAGWGGLPDYEEVIREVFGMSAEEFRKVNSNVPVFTYPASRYENGTETPLVSVIIPVYNVEEFLDECVNSVFAQTLTELEIICVNDGSPDHSLEMLLGYREKDDRVAIVSQLNGGLSAARNSGFRVAHGQYVYFLDSDDWILPDTLKTLYDQAEKNGTDVILFGAESFFETPQMKKEHADLLDYYKRKPLPKEVVSGTELAEIYNNSSLFRSSVPLQFYRRSFLTEQAVSFCEGILYEDELYTACILMRAERISVNTHNFYQRRVRASSITTQTLTHRNFEGRFIVYSRLLAEALNLPDSAAEAKRFLSGRAEVMLQSAKDFFSALPDSEKPMIMVSRTPELQLLYQCVFLSSASNGYGLHLETEALRSSAEYRIGSFFTFIPRKWKGLMKCYRDHSFRYTVIQVLKALHLHK